MKYEIMRLSMAALSAFMLGIAISSTSVQNSWRLDAAATSCAQFNPAHGQFEWLEKSE